MSEKYPSELWNDPVFHKGREWGRMEREEVIIAKLMSSLIEFQYWNGLTSHRINPTEHTKDEAEAILRNIIKED